MGSLEAAQARILATMPHEKASIRIRLRPILDGVTVLLAIASIIFAYVQKLDSRDLKNKTELLLGSVTTGYIAEFPQSIPAITKIVQGTCSDLSIMADVPGYGQYSAPDAFYWYMHSIIDLKHRTVKNNHDSGRCIGKRFESNSRVATVPAALPYLKMAECSRCRVGAICGFADSSLHPRRICEDGTPPLTCET